MPSPGPTQSSLRSVPVVAWCYGPALGLIVAGIVFGLTRLPDDPVPLLLAASLLVLALLLAPVALHAQAIRGSLAHGPERERLDHIAQLLQALHEQAALSDDARRVLNRSHERRLLRAAIEEDIAVEDYDAAMVLVEELANRFGYRADAEEFRTRIEDARRFSREQAIAAAVAHLDSLISDRRWEHALQEAARIGRLYPDAPQARDLEQRVQRALASYKQDLERRFTEAARDGRSEEAMDLLRELDAYLTEAEAEPFRQTARAVIDDLKRRLGEEFKRAVHDKDYATARRIGRRIMDEFPNARMSQEVRGVLEGIDVRLAAGTDGDTHA